MALGPLLPAVGRAGAAQLTARTPSHHFRRAQDWTKAVMVAQPSDTLAFSHEYFTKLSLQGRKKGDSTIQGDAKGGSNLTMSQLAMSAGKVYQSLPIPLQARIEEVFSACDTDGSGAISKAEFFKTIQQVRTFPVPCAWSHSRATIANGAHGARLDLLFPTFPDALPCLPPHLFACTDRRVAQRGGHSGGRRRAVE